MMRVLGVLVLTCLPLQTVLAAGWSFDKAIEVTPQPAGKVFHHLDGAGRRNIAAGDKGVALAWEDDRDGTPRIYFAYKAYGGDRFTTEQRISGEEEAYEPGLTALSDERFALVWEEQGAIWLRLVRFGDSPALGPRIRISHEQGAQATLTSEGDRLFVLWSEREGRYGRIRSRSFRVQGLDPLPQSDCPVDAAAPTDEQLYPAATLVRGRLVVAWEDRRPKHTIIMAAAEKAPGACLFSEPARISEKPEGRNLPYGTGHGVSRVAIDCVGEDKAFAAWADKRSFRNGYDIWGAYYDDDSRSFGKNERVQDDFGGLSKQRHAAVAGLADGELVVAWDDEREGNTDLMLSWREMEGWSDDWPLPVASGSGLQGSPSIVFDHAGNLHATWVERQAAGGTTRLLYAFGRVEKR